jgi:tRNA A-37 threonylcarbamoyl transferase component Bud32
MNSAAVGAGFVLSGRYRLVEPLASGGMGTVWRALDLLLDRPVAVKEVRLPPSLDDDARQLLRRRTIREAQVAARLRHPAVVTIFDVVEQDGRPWIVMELVPSRSLAEIIRTDGPLPPARVAGIGLRVLDAIVTAAAAGVEHRDIKPANVLVTTQGRVVLTDFGIARHVGDDTLTSAGLIVGSPDYLAPERARGRTGGLAADLWSLGATMYDAVEGRRPFERNGPLPTLAAVVMDEPDPPQRAGPLRPVIDGLLVKDPAHRLDADRTRSMLQRVLRGRPAGGTVPLPRHPSDDRPPPSAPEPAAEPPVVIPMGPTRPWPADGAADAEPPGAADRTTPSTPVAGEPTAATADGTADTAAAAVTEPAGTAPAGTAPAGTELADDTADTAAAAGTAPAGTEPADTAPAGAEPADGTADTGAAAGTELADGRADDTASTGTEPSIGAHVPTGAVEPTVTEPANGRAAGPTGAAAVAGSAVPASAEGRTGAESTAADAERMTEAAAGRMDGSTAVAGSVAARSADAPAGDGSGRGRTPTLPGAPPRDPRRRRRSALLAGLVVLVLAGIAAALVPVLGRDPGNGAAGPAGQASGPAGQGRGPAATAPATGRTAPTASSGAPTSRPATTASRTPAPTTRATTSGNAPPTGADVAAPAGFTRYTDPIDGFSLVVPAGWRPVRSKETLVDFDDPTSSRFLRIDTSDHALPDPYQNWIDYERQFRQGKPDYQLIGIRRVPDYRPDEGWTTADWEFMLGSTHVLDRNIRVSASRAHAIYWSTPQSQWNTADSRRILQLAEQSFVPAPAGS